MKKCQKFGIALIFFGAIFVSGEVQAYTVLPLRNVGQDDIATLHPTYQLTEIHDAKATEWLPQFKPERWPTMAPFSVAVDKADMQARLPVPPGFATHKLLKLPTQGKVISVAITPSGRVALLTQNPNEVHIYDWHKTNGLSTTIKVPIKQAIRIEFLSHAKLLIATPEQMTAYRIKSTGFAPHDEINQRLNRYGRGEIIRDIGRNQKGELIVLTNKHLVTYTSAGYLVSRLPVNLPLIGLTTDEENNIWLLDKTQRHVHHWSPGGQRIGVYSSFVSEKGKINEIVAYKKFLAVCTKKQVGIKLIQKPLKLPLQKPIGDTLADKRRSFIEMQQTYRTEDEAAKRYKKDLIDASREEKEYKLPDRN